jgi:hypothetical protein
MANIADNDDGWTYPNRPLLQHYIVSLMSYKHGRWEDPYDNSCVFSKEELLSIRPMDVQNWLALQAFGRVDPNIQNDIPDNARASSLKKAKSGVSIFMPNRHVAWIEGRGGNPTIYFLVPF